MIANAEQPRHSRGTFAYGGEPNRLYSYGMEDLRHRLSDIISRGAWR